MRLVVGMTGATGAVFGVRLLQHLAGLPSVETHLVLSRWARTTIELETGLAVREVAALADEVYTPRTRAPGSPPVPSAPTAWSSLRAP